MKKLLLYGANLADAIKLVNAINAHAPSWELIGFIDDNKDLHGKEILGSLVIGGYESIPELLKKDPDLCIFNNVNESLEAKRKIVSRIQEYTNNIPSLVHPDVNLEYVTVGKGVFIPDGCVIGTRSVIGNHVTFRYNATVSHDVEVEDFVFVGPGSMTTGNVTLKEGCYLGACCCIINGVTVGKESVVGASAMVHKNVPAGITVTGVPAKELIKT